MKFVCKIERFDYSEMRKRIEGNWNWIEIIDCKVCPFLSLSASNKQHQLSSSPYQLNSRVSCFNSKAEKNKKSASFSFF